MSPPSQLICPCLGLPILVPTTKREAGQYVDNVLCTVVLWWLGKEEGALMKDQEPYRAD